MSQTIGIGGVNFSWPGDLDHAARLDFIHAELQVKVAPYPDISWFEWPVIHGVRVRATAEYTSSRGDQAAWRRYHEENFNDEDDEDNEALFAASFVNPTDEDAEREEFEWLAAVAEREVGVQHADKQVRAISDYGIQRTNGIYWENKRSCGGSVLAPCFARWSCSMETGRCAKHFEELGERHKEKYKFS